MFFWKVTGEARCCPGLRQGEGRGSPFWGNIAEERSNLGKEGRKVMCESSLKWVLLRTPQFSSAHFWGVWKKIEEVACSGLVGFWVWHTGYWILTLASSKEYSHFRAEQGNYSLKCASVARWFLSVYSFLASSIWVPHLKYYSYNNKKPK